MAGATVNVHEIDGKGFPIGEPLTSTTTDASGEFQVEAGDVTSPLLIETSGGSFVDEADQAENQRSIQLAEGEGLLSILLPGESTVAITPLTHAIVARAREEAVQTQAFADVFGIVKDRFSEQAGFDLFATLPADPTDPSGSDQEIRYALLLGGLANVINSASIALGEAAPSFHVIEGVIRDLSDGLIDGLSFGEPVFAGESTLPANISLDEALVRFRNNNFASYEGASLPAVEAASLQEAVVPEADAGEDVDAVHGETVVLDASGSSSAVGSLTFEWRKASGPEVNLSGLETATPEVEVFNLLGSGDGAPVSVVMELLVTDENGIVATDTVTINVAALGSGESFSTTRRELPFQFGRTIVSGARFVYQTDGTGTAFNAFGQTDFEWTTTKNQLIIDYSIDGGQLVSSFATEETEVQRFLDRAEVTFEQEDDRLFAVGVQFGRDVEANFADGTTTSAEFEEPVRVRVTDILDVIPLVPAGRRILEVDVDSSVETLMAFPPLFPDELTFNDDGTGTTRFKNEPFTWETIDDGTLEVNLEGGDTATFYHLFSAPEADAIHVTYNGGEANITFPSHADPTGDLVWTPSDVIAQHVANGFFELADGSSVSFPVYYHVFEDGTGFLQIVNVQDSVSGRRVLSQSSFGICWSIAGDGTLVVNRVRPSTFDADGDSTPSPEDCAAQPNDQLFFQRSRLPFEKDGNTIRTLSTTSQSNCLFAGPECVVELELTNLFAASFDLFPYEGSPPRLRDDEVVADPATTAIDIDVLANDLTGDHPIDAGSLELLILPRNGEASIDADGRITYLANGGELRNDSFAYRVRDTAGNRSTLATVSIRAAQPAPAGSTLTLDASSLTSQQNVLYNWFQTAGPPVELEDTNSATLTVDVPAPLAVEQELRFTVNVSASDGQNFVLISEEFVVNVEPALSSSLVVFNNLLPGLGFGGLAASCDLCQEGGDFGTFVELAEDGTGSLRERKEVDEFDWSEDASGFVADFSRIGGAVESESVSFEVIDDSGEQKEIITTEYLDIARLELDVKDGKAWLADLEEEGRIERFNATDGELLSSEPTFDRVEKRHKIYDLVDAESFAPGSGRVLPVNVATGTDTFTFGNELRENEVLLDELTFNGDGTGSANLKAQSFTWSQTDSALEIEFEDGERGRFRFLDDTEAGPLTVVEYEFVDGSSSVLGATTATMDPSLAVDSAALAGTYRTTTKDERVSGELTASEFRYKVRPDGVGTLELVVFDGDDLIVDAPVYSGQGICASVDADGRMVFDRIQATGPATTPYRDQTATDCETRTDADVFRQFTWEPIEAVSSETTRFLLTIFSDECHRQGFEQSPDCDDVNFDITSRILVTTTKVNDDGETVLPWTIWDRLQTSPETPGTIEVLANDFQTTFQLDPATVEIAIEPLEGTASVDATTGAITYTPDPDARSDRFYYTVRDVQGNISNLGTVLVEVF